MVTCEIFDVMTIVTPVDVQNQPEVERKKFDLFDDHPQLHSVHVANSCTWHNSWVTSRHIAENMACTFTFLQNNTEENLWLKCLETYEECHPIQQGGPLMAHLILQRIQDSSEQALDLLSNQVKVLNTSELPGEDIEKAVSSIKSTHRILQCSSTQTRSHVPTDFARTVFQVFQTTTVPEFNEVFRCCAVDIQLQADPRQVQPCWPSIGAAVGLVTNTHRRLKQTGVWDGKVKAPPLSLIHI